MADKKNKYKVTSPIKHAGKRHEVGDELLLTESEAEGLHVELSEAAPATEEKSTEPAKKDVDTEKAAAPKSTKKK